jgi:hypothetical protein
VAISPDGKYILSVVGDKGQQSLWLRNVPTNSNMQSIAAIRGDGIEVGLRAMDRRKIPF